MVVLRTFSQAKSFYKRMQKKHNFHVDEGCGCCYSGANVEVDDKKSRIVLRHYGENKGYRYLSYKVLGVIKKKR